MLNRKCTICSTSKPYWEIRSAYKPFFHRYLPIGCAYSAHRRLELEIRRFSCRRRQQQLQQQQTYKPIALPLAHARGVMMLGYFGLLLNVQEQRPYHSSTPTSKQPLEYQVIFLLPYDAMTPQHLYLMVMRGRWRDSLNKQLVIAFLCRHIIN